MTDEEAQALLDDDKCPLCGAVLEYGHESTGDEYGAWEAPYCQCRGKEHHGWYVEEDGSNFHPVWALSYNNRN